MAYPTRRRADNGATVGNRTSKAKQRTRHPPPRGKEFARISEEKSYEVGVLEIIKALKLGKSAALRATL